MVGTIAVFMNSKTVVSPHEHSQNSLEIFQLSRKTSTSPRQCRNIMAQISVDTLHREGVTLVVNIEDMISGKNDIYVAGVPICAILSCLGSRVHHLLNGLG